MYVVLNVHNCLFIKLYNVHSNYQFDRSIFGIIHKESIII